MEKKLRLLVHTKGEPSWNMAVDEALFLSSKKPGAFPVLRVYTWKKRCVTFGCHVPRENAISHAASLLPPGRRAPLLRRPTGGGIVLHDDDLTFSLCGDSRLFSGMSRAEDSYARIHQAVVDGFRFLARFGQELVLNCGEDGKEKHGSHASVCFREPVKHDVMLGNKKLAGGAQKRSGNYFLHQGTLQDLDGKFTFSQALSALCEGMQNAFSVRFQISTLTAEERSKAAVLEHEKYRSKMWNEYGDYKGRKKSVFVGQSMGKIRLEGDESHAGH